MTIVQSRSALQAHTKAKSRQKDAEEDEDDDEEEPMNIKQFIPLSWAVLSRQEPGLCTFL